MRKIILSLILILGTVLVSFAQPEEIILDKGWKAKRALEVPVDGTVISTHEFDLYDWMEAVVPGTVLTTLLHNKKVPDPFFGMNNELIPDIYETGPEYYTFWFLNRFSVPELKEDVQVWRERNVFSVTNQGAQNGPESVHVLQGMRARAKGDVM